MFGWMDYLAPGMVAHAVLALRRRNPWSCAWKRRVSRYPTGISRRAVCRTFAWASRSPYRPKYSRVRSRFWSYPVRLYRWTPSRTKLLLLLKAPRSPVQYYCFYDRFARCAHCGGFPVSLSLFLCRPPPVSSPELPPIRQAWLPGRQHCRISKDWLPVAAIYSVWLTPQLTPLE
jgi:hypothetical protein